MNAPLSVSLLDPHWSWARALVATLPGSLRLSNDVTGESLAIVDGTRPWPREVMQLLSRGCRHLFVVESGDVEPDALLALADAAESSGAQVIVSEGFAGNPAIAGFGAWLDRGFSMLTAQGTGLTVQSSLLQQLRILRALDVTEPEMRSVLVTSEAFLVELEGGRADAPTTLRLTGAVCEAAAPRQIITAFAAEVTARLALDAGSEARPASATLTTPEGQQLLPTIYESAHRHALRMLVAPHGEAGSGQSARQLRMLAGDIALARSMIASG